jgi:hypothetical protein
MADGPANTPSNSPNENDVPRQSTFRSRLNAPAALIMAGLDQASGHIERGEKGRGSVTFVGMTEPCHRSAIGQLQPALGALQSLDVRLLVDRKHHGVRGRLQVEPDNVGRLLRKGRIGADTPTEPPRQRDLMPAQNPPDGDVAQMAGQQAAVPAPVPRWRRLIQSCQDAPLMLALVLPGLAAARRVEQTRKTRRAKRPRHLLTVAGRVPSRSATALLLSPSATAKITSARNAMRRSVFPAPSQPLKLARCSSVNTTSAALITADYHDATTY